MHTEHKKIEIERVKEEKEDSLPRDVGMINAKLSQRWRGETTAMGESHGQVQKKGYDREGGEREMIA